MAWHLIKSGEDGSNSGYAYKEFLLDAESDINNEPTEFGPIAIGSRAHIVGNAVRWEKSASGWMMILAGGSYDIIIDGSVSCADDGAGNITITW